MARKRMIDPEIWENQRFGEMSLIARFLWIGLISHADDEGKGKASPSILKRNIFGFDSTTRATDIEKTLTELSSKMSITLYEINGEKFYKLDKWFAWQSIQKPKKSKIPDPPLIDGVRGDIVSERKIQYEYSTDTVQVQDEYSTSINDKEKKKAPQDPLKKNRNISLSQNARTREEIPDWIKIDKELSSDELSLLAELIPYIESNPYLKQWKYASKYLDNAKKIKDDYYKQYTSPKKKVSPTDSTGYAKHEYTAEQLNEMFYNVDGELK